MKQQLCVWIDSETLRFPKLGKRVAGGLKAAIVGLFGLCLVPGFGYGADEFTGLGDLAGGAFESEAGDTNADGSVVVGYGTSANGEEAMRWTQAGGMVGLGDLPGGAFESGADGVSADGSVVVGYGISANGHEAFRWTQAGGMVGLGDLPGGAFDSRAQGINADGSIVVGYGTSANGEEAFRWTQAGGMVGLGDLPGGTFGSEANGVNVDGSVIVGDGASANGEEAFRWTQVGGMVGLGDLAGGPFHSEANGVNADGSVVVGLSDSANGEEAFRWTQAGGMVGLGDLPGGLFESVAGAVSADGSVVVGHGTSANGSEAFRWTQATGMQSVADWLGDAGVTVVGWALAGASDVSDDGTVVVGWGDNPSGAPEAWLARANSGLISLTTISNSLNTVSTLTGSVTSQTSTILHGAHGHPNSNRDIKGKNCFWVAGDWSENRHDNDASAGLAEIGGCYNPSPSLQLGLGIGKTWGDEDLAFGGDIDTDGTYIIADIGAQVPNTPFWFTLTGIYGESDATIDRGYENAGTLDSSRGKTDLTTRAIRGRFDWDNAWHNSRIGLSPYAEYNIIRTKYDGYTETGGGFPARFDGKTETVHDLRIGANGTYALNGTTRLLGTLEGVHRFDEKGVGVSGQMIGLFGFNLDGNDYDQDWLRITAGVEHKIANGLLSVTANVATEGEDPSFWGGMGYRVGFN